MLKRRAVLERFCSSIFRIFKNAAVRECFAGEVPQGMNVIGPARERTMMAESERTQECAATVPGSLVPDRKGVMGDSGDFLGRLVNYSKAVLLSAVLLGVFIVGSASASLAFTTAPAAPSGALDKSSKDMVKILSVMQSRTTNRTILDKAADKLSAMEGRRLRILSSLCDRISEDSHTAGADIAFSLMTVLIVLS